MSPLGVGRRSAWLCDLVPHTCLNPSQEKALQREYEPRRVELGLPEVDLPSVPNAFGDDDRRREILAEVESAEALVIVLLGDHPIRHFLRTFDKRWRRLADFGTAAETYGRPHDVEIHGKIYPVLPLAHSRQVGGLGSPSKSWRDLHTGWKEDAAPSLLGGLV